MSLNEKSIIAKFVAEMNQQEYIDYEGMCWECWDEQLTEESDSMFGGLMQHPEL